MEAIVIPRQEGAERRHMRNFRGISGSNRFTKDKLYPFSPVNRDISISSILDSFNGSVKDRVATHTISSGTTNAAAVPAVTHNVHPTEQIHIEECPEGKILGNSSNCRRLSEESSLQTGMEALTLITKNHNLPSINQDHPGDSHNVRECEYLNQAEEEFDWIEEYEQLEASLHISMCPEPSPQDISQCQDVFIPEDPIAPTLVPAPTGSGRKGKDKSHEDYAAAASKFGWGGSYNTYGANGNARGGRSEEDEEPENGEISGSGSGSNGGRDGSGGDDRGGGSTESVEDRNKQKLARSPAAESGTAAPKTLQYGVSRDPAYVSSGYVWTCCECNRSTSSGYQLFCTDCSHLRCNNCQQWRARK